MRMELLFLEISLEDRIFAVNGKWSISINKDDIDYDKLKEMHDKYKGYMLINDSYMNCKKSWQ